MITKDLQGNTIKISLGGTYQNSKRSAKSSYHLEARKLLHEIFSSVQILEEVPIPIRKGQTCFFDFFIPLFGIFIEIQGQAHYTRIGFFQSDNDFLRQQKRDKDKKEWCEINGFSLIELRFDEQDKWRNILK